ncbi:MAG: GAF domain-containing protein, partial [Deltaproteobacteria bacterium]|nr:GAF domain-containing protein [Deltaproteobacteria bacterium]
GLFEEIWLPLDEDKYSDNTLREKKPFIYEGNEHSPMPPAYDLLDKDGTPWIELPLLVDEEPIGLISIDNKHSQKPLVEGDMQRLIPFAKSAAQAIKTARKHDSLRNRAQEAETLRETALTLTTSLDQHEIFERILTELQKVVPYDSAAVQLLKGNHLEIIGIHGFPNPSEIIGLSFSVEGNNPNRNVIDQQNYYIVPDVSVAYEHFLEEPLVQAGIRSWLGVPMLVGNKLIGMITLDKHEADFYTEEHARLALAFAAQAAIAIENARAYEAEQNARENVALLLDTINTVANARDLDEGLHAFAEKMVTGLGVTFCHIMLLDDNKQNLLIKAAYPIHRLESTNLKWMPGVGMVIDLLQVGIMQHILDLPKPEVFRKGEVVGGLDVIRHIQETVRLEETLESALVISLRTGQKIFGFCTLGEVRSQNRSPFTKDKIALANSMAAQAAVLIDRMRTHETIQRRALEAGQRIITYQPFRENLKHIIDELRDELNYDVVILYPYDFNQDDFDNPVISGEVRTRHAIRPVKKGAIVLERIRKGPDSHFSSAATNAPLLPDPFTRGENIRASGFLRIKAENQIVGLLFIHKRSNHQFSKDEQKIIQGYAERVKKEIQRTSILQSIVDSLHQAMSFDVIMLYQYDATKNKLSRPFTSGVLTKQ